MDRDSIIQWIYEASAFPDKWPQALEAFGQTCNAPRFVLLTRRADSWTGFLAAKPIQAAFSNYMESGIAPRSDTTRRLLARRHAGFLTDVDLFREDEWEREPLRNDWARIWGLNRATATGVELPSGDFIVVHGHKVEGEPPFSASEIARLDSFRPHLARAGLLAARWRMQRLASAAEALALVGLPAAIIDHRGKMLAANALLERVAAHVHTGARDRVRLSDPRADALLASALQKAVSSRRGATGSIPLLTESAPIVVHLIPAVGNAAELFGGPMTIMAVTEISTPIRPDITLVRALFDLSPGEARIATGLATGLTLEQLAQLGSVSRETVRTQLKGVLAKTGTKRQAEVAALLAGLRTIPLSK